MRLFVLLLILSCLQGCAALLVAGGLGVASSAHDRRTLGTQIDDQTLQNRINNQLDTDEALQDKSHINVNVYNGIALMVGQVPTQDDKNQAGTLAGSVENLRKLHNQLRLGEPTAAGTRTSDVWIQSKVKTKLLADERIDGLHVEVIVEDSEVFLMGLVTENEASIAVDITRNVSGVVRVVKAFEYKD